MSKHSPSTAREVCSILDRAGLAFTQHGSHRTYKMSDGALFTVPCHNGRHKDLSPGLRAHAVKVLLSYGLLVVMLALALGAVSIIL